MNGITEPWCVTQDNTKCAAGAHLDRSSDLDEGHVHAIRSVMVVDDVDRVVVGHQCRQIMDSGLD